MNRSYITDTESFVKNHLTGESTGHDWWHAQRIRATALSIQAVEGGDKDVIELAALLHDVGDRKILNTIEDDPTVAQNFLVSIGVNQATIDAVMYIISNMSYSKSIDSPDIEKPLELQIVQDADRLDAVGAIGVARAFAYGGSKGRPLYDPTVKAQEFTSTLAYKTSLGTTLHHFDEKLFRLKGTFNTKHAEEIASERDLFMHEFYDRFLKEWDGQA